MHQQGRLEEAQVIYESILKLQASHFNALQLLGVIFLEKKQFIHSINLITKALQIQDNQAPCYYNLGSAQQGLQQYEEAIARYDKAVAINQEFAKAHHDRGVALQELQRLEEAITSYENAIAIQGSYPEASWNLSLCQLQVGNFHAGWRGYEWRWKNSEISKTAGLRNLKQKLWLGAESLQGKTILLHAEQGFGDTIQFCRFTRLVSQLGAKVILEVQPSLVSLLQNLEGVSKVIARGDPIPECDYQCPLMSLPLALNTDLNNIPGVPKKFITCC